MDELAQVRGERLEGGRADPEPLHFFVQSSGAQAEACCSAPLMAMVLFKGMKNELAFKITYQGSEVPELRRWCKHELLRSVKKMNRWV